MVQGRRTRRRVVVGLLVAALAVVPYLQTLGRDFTSYDDVTYLVEAYEHWRRPSLDALARDLVTPLASQVLPVRALSYFADRCLFGATGAAVRPQSLAWAAAGAALVVVVGLRLGLGLRAAGLAGVLFAVHPTHAEPTCWAVGRDYLISSAFVLLGLLVYLGRTPASPAAGLGARRWAGVAACLALALLARANVGVALVPWLFAAAWARRRLRRDAPWLIALLGLALADALATAWLNASGRLAGGTGLPLAERAGRVVAAVGFDLLHLVVPWPLSPAYGPARPPAPLELAAVVTALACGVALVVRGARREASLLAMLLTALVPTAGVIPHNIFVADRYLLLASAPAALLAAAVLGRLLSRASPERARVVRAGVTGLLFLCVGATVRYAHAWRTHVDLRRWAVQVRDDAGTRTHLAAALVGGEAPAEGEAEAERLARSALAASGDDPLPHQVLAAVALRRGELDVARRHLEVVAASQWTSHREASLALVGLLLDLDARDEALTALERLEARGAPGDPAVALLRGDVLLARGDLPGAAAAYQASLAAASPHVAEAAWAGLARAERRAGRAAAAEEAAARVPAARGLRAHLALDGGRLDEAEALLAAPPAPEVEERLARLRLLRRRGASPARLRQELAELLDRAHPAGRRVVGLEPDLRDLLP